MAGKGGPRQAGGRADGGRREELDPLPAAVGPADLDTGPAAGGGERGSRGDDRPRDGEQFRGRDVREGELEDDLPGDEARGRTPVGRLGAGRGLPARE